MEDLYIEEKFKNLNIRVDNCEGRITANEKKIAITDKEFAVALQGINSSMNSLATLPNVISDIDKTIGQMKGTMELMQVELRRNTEEIGNIKDDISKQNKQISEIDDEGKFNIRLWLKNNWIVLVLGAGSVLALVEYITYRFPAS